jgi:outer membrane protein TolC
MNWQNALAACDTLTLAGSSDWRLPEIRELIALADYRATSSALDPLFSGNTSGVYWSATTVAATPNNAWTLRMSDGQFFGVSKTANFVVRCVTDAP